MKVNQEHICPHWCLHEWEDPNMGSMGEWFCNAGWQKAKAQSDTLLAALRSVEWTNAVDGGSVCAWCGGRKYDGHAPDCQRQAAIAAVEGE